MADPTPYVRGFSFTDYQTATPQNPLPGQHVDVELDELAGTVNALVGAVLDVRRSDGKLQNGSVTAESLNTGLQAGLIDLAANAGSAVAAQIHADRLAAEAAQAAAVAAVNPSLFTYTAPGTGAVPRLLLDRAKDTVNVRDFGAKGDLLYSTVAVTIASGSSALIVGLATFAAGDVGKKIVIPGAGAAGAALVTSISAFTDSTHVTLAGTAGTALSASSQLIGWGTDDTLAINAALAYRTPAGSYGASVFVPSGNYLVSGLLTAGGYAGRFYGAASGNGAGLPGGSTVITTIDPTGDVLNVTGFNGQAQGFSLRTAVAKTAGIMLILSGASSSATDITITGHRNGIELRSTGNRIDRCVVGSPGTAGTGSFAVNVNGGFNAKIVFSDFGTTSGVKTESGIRLQNAGDILIHGCQVLAFKRGLNVTPGKFGTAEEVDSIYASETFFDAADEYGIILDPGVNGKVQRCHFIGCWSIGGQALAGGDGFRFAGDSGSIIETINIIGHEGWYTLGATGHGLNISSSGTIRDVNVIGSSFAQNGANGINVGTGVQRFKIIGCQCGASGSGTAGNTGNGIALQGSNDAYIISNNNLLGNTGGTLFGHTKAPTRVVENNLGFVSRASGTASAVPNASGQITVAHGMSGTPSQVNANAFAGSSTTVTIAGLDATNITFGLFSGTTAITTGTQNVYWQAVL